MRRFTIGDIHGAHKALKHVLKASKFNYKEDTLICIGDVADGWPEVPQCFEELLKIKHLVYIEGNHDCVDTETELFTNNGWKKYNEICCTDKVVGINSNGLSQWQPIDDIIIKQTNELYEMDNSRISLCITKNHRILHQNVGGYTYNTLSSYDPSNSRWRVPLASFSSVFKDYNISDDMLRLLAWVLTDGSISNSGQIILYQSKTNTLLRIKELLHSLDIAFSEYGRQRHRKEICGRQLKNKPLRAYSLALDLEVSRKIILAFSLKKNSLPKWMFSFSYRQARLFIKEMLLGDGTSYRYSNCHILYGTEEFLSDVQALCSINGMVANLTKDNRNTFRLNLNETLTSSLRGGWLKHEGDFTVWCLSVPLTNFMIRRHGKVCFTGNSWLYQYLRFGSAPEIWTMQGGMASLLAYTKIINKKGRDMADRHAELLKNALSYYVTEDNKLFVHGGYNWHEDISTQSRYDLTWDRNLFIAAVMWHEKKTGDRVKDYDEVFIGHTTTSRYRPDLTPVHVSNVWALDQGGGWEGKLTLLDVDSKQYWQSPLVYTLYPNIKGRR